MPALGYRSGVSEISTSAGPAVYGTCLSPVRVNVLTRHRGHLAEAIGSAPLHHPRTSNEVTLFCPGHPPVMVTGVAALDTRDPPERPPPRTQKLGTTDDSVSQAVSNLSK